MVTALETSLSGVNSPETRVRCFAHILNLIIKVPYFFLVSSCYTNLRSGHHFSVHAQEEAFRGRPWWH